MLEPPYVDEHAVEVEASVDRTWDTLDAYVDAALTTGRSSVLSRLLGTAPASGFGVASRVSGERVELTGRHRFSHYRLVFSVRPGDVAGTSRLVATTYAASPGRTERCTDCW